MNETLDEQTARLKKVYPTYDPDCLDEGYFCPNCGLLQHEDDVLFGLFPRVEQEEETK